jgi:hypothetical protein
MFDVSYDRNKLKTRAATTREKQKQKQKSNKTYDIFRVGGGLIEGSEGRHLIWHGNHIVL